MAQKTDRIPLPWIAAGAAVLIFWNRVSAWFAPAQPGGNVTPGAEDNRPATLTLSAAGALADAIEQAVWGGGLIAQPWERDADFAAALMVPQTTADVRLLMNSYGERGTVLSPLTLSATVSTYLDSDYKSAVNRDYEAKGIQIRWV